MVVPAVSVMLPNVAGSGGEKVIVPLIVTAEVFCDSAQIASANALRVARVDVRSIFIFFWVQVLWDEIH